MTRYEQHHLTVDRDGDDFILRQIDHSGNEASVAMHLSQVAHLAEKAGVTSGARNQQERALLRLWGKLFLLTADFNLDEIGARCGDGLAYQAHALDARNILADILEDLGIAAPTYEDEEAARAPSNGNSPSNDKSGDGGISVTQSKRGRPATGTAMTNAERQARYRAKQANLLAPEPA